VADEGPYHPSQDQLAISSAIDDALAGILPLSRLHDAALENAELWAELDALGPFAMTVSEELGGSGLGATEEALIVIALGRRLVSPTVLATIGAVHAKRDHASVIQGMTPRVAAAYRRADKVLIIEDPDAQLFLLREETHAALYRAPRPFDVLDDRYWLSSLCGVKTLGEPVASYDAAGLRRLRLLDAAALTGVAEAALEMAVDYARMREQFGRAIGSFQAVKHHCANMAIAARCARDQTSFAAVAIDQARPDAEFQVESALLTAGLAAIENASKNIQIHGGIGFSEEADPHLLLKRAQLLNTLAGGLEAAVARIGDLPPVTN
jgi:alkylation response protein AidB-like acyl-CoA dehydrogenase